MNIEKSEKNKLFTLMVVPHNGKKILSLEVSIFFMAMIGFLLCLTLFSALFFSYKHITNQASVLQSTAQLSSEKEKSKKLASDIQKVSQLNNTFSAELEKTNGILNNPPSNTSISSEQAGDFSQALYLDVAEQEDDAIKTIASLTETLNKNIPLLANVNKALETHTSLMKELPVYWPVPNSVISAEWGANIHPVYGSWYIHKGLDFAAVTGTPVYAAAEGVVTETGYDRGHGLNVYVSHKYGFKTHYSHLSVIKVTKGQEVKQGQRLGNVGATGLVTGPHLHLEVYLGEEIIDPGVYMKLLHSKRYAQVMRIR